MKNLEEIKISFFEDKWKKANTVKSISLIIREIIKGKWKNEILTIRRYHDMKDEESATKQKNKLPCFTASGVFRARHAIGELLRHSEIILLDFDHVENLIALADLCKADPHTAFAFCSPTDGYKVGVFVENANGRHREAYALVADYYNRLTGLETDKACKDESRLCFVSYDPEGYIAALYQTFVLPKEEETGSEETVNDELLTVNDEQLTADRSPFESSPFTAPPSAPPSAPGRFVSSYIFLNPIIKGERDTSLFKLGCEAAKRGYDRSDIFREILPFFNFPDFGEDDIIRPLISGYKTVEEKKEGSPINSKNNHDRQLTANRQYRCPENDDASEESYWQGEELRRQTPCIPNSVYENIPNLQNECLFDDISPRERDILLLGNLVAFSAIMPGVRGIYNKKNYSTHLYCFGIAPAGSGKSITEWGRELLSKTHEHIRNESEAAAKEYEKEHLKWQLQYAAKVKNKQAEELPKEPEEPPYRYLIIPATTSHTRMQIQLRDNGNLGGIIYDTEAQTLANANSMDCGKLDDMLCKAFEHENIDSSFKANGKRPIYIRNPRLAIMLTGTPTQFNMLIPTPENGLFSRVMTYTFRSDAHWKEMGNDEFNASEHYEHLSTRALKLYHFYCEHNMQFHFTPSQWKKLNTTFGKLLSEVNLDSNDNLQAVVKRFACIVMRISMVLSALRKFEHQDAGIRIECNDIDFQTALSIVLCCYQHSRLLLSSMPAAPAIILKSPDTKRSFFLELPNQFTTEEALILAEKHNLSSRTVQRLLKQLTGKEINKLSIGVYEKRK